MEIRSNTYPDFSSAEEVDVKMFANGADVSVPGAVWNIVTKSGGNQTHGRLSELYISPTFQADNLDDTLRAQGLSYPNSLKYFTDFGADLGGKIVKDKLWFYGAYRNRQNKQAIPGLSAATGPDGLYSTADDVAYLPVIYTHNYTGKLSSADTELPARRVLRARLLGQQRRRREPAGRAAVHSAGSVDDRDVQSDELAR